MSQATLSHFARGLSAETAFDVLAVARRLKAAGKDVIELQIGDSPFASTSAARAAGKHAIDGGLTRYGPSAGLPEFREAAAKAVREEFGVPAKAENVVAAPGAKPFELFFCEAFLEPGDEVLLFSPQFPTYEPNVALFSDEPYCHMAWSGRHHSILAEPGMMDQCVAAYTFSKSYSMSGWRLGYAVASAEVAQVMAKMINTSL